MSALNSTLYAVLENWADHVSSGLRIQALGGAGGFSGASFWRVATPEQTYCLRRWPQEHPSQERLAWIHQVLEFVARQTDLPLALPIPTRMGHSFVLHSKHLWELSPWLPGEPVEFLAVANRKVQITETELLSHLKKAMQALALFHQAATACPFVEPASAPTEPNLRISPGLQSRAQRIQQLLQPEYLPALRTNVLRGTIWPAGASVALSILEKVGLLAPRVSAEVQSIRHLPVPLQPCVRDIWSDHLLFQEGEITGWVDFGAMRNEVVSGDIARLLGSMAGDNPDRWQAGLQAYENTRPLSDRERTLVRTFDNCQVLLSGMNWIEWIFQQQRVFERLDRIETRLDNIHHRLSHHLQTPESFY